MHIRTRACLLVATLSLAIAGCGGSAATPSPSTSAAPPSSEPSGAAATAEPSPIASATTPTGSVAIYTVRKSDTLTTIARRFKTQIGAKTTAAALKLIIAANPQLKDPNKLTIGMKLNIPLAASSPSA